MTNTARYLVLAAICDCEGVAISVLDDCYDPHHLEPEENEVLYVGPDWQPLVTRAAAELHARTGLPVLARCTVVVSQRQAQLTDEVTDALYAAYGAAA